MVAALLVELERHDRHPRTGKEAFSYATQLISTNQPIRAPRSQEYDLAPRFPELNRFLAFWSANLEGPLYRVRVAHKALLGPAELRAVNGEYRLN